MKLQTLLKPTITAVGLTVLLGCASTYVPPKGRADLKALSETHSMEKNFAREPTARFPAHIAAVRLQAPQYRNYFTDRCGGVYGHGNYTVVLAREHEIDEQLETLRSLHDLGGLATLNRLLLPERLDTDLQLREAASRLKADMLLVYSFDTSFRENDASHTLTLVTLGFSPTRKITVDSTASALLMDTRTGFIYAALEAHAAGKARTNSWESKEAADRERRTVEEAAFAGLVEEVKRSWPMIVARAGEGA